ARDLHPAGALLTRVLAPVVRDRWPRSPSPRTDAHPLSLSGFYCVRRFAAVCYSQADALYDSFRPLDEIR
ncbi:MAG: hypothetical protein ACC655_09230, partial [Rhodothermia bacterium]